MLSLSEEIAGLEAQLENTKGPGSISKKEEIRKRIAELKALNTDDDGPNEAQTVNESPVSRPVLGSWIQATLDEVKQYESTGVLIGFDPVKMVVLIKDRTV